MTKRNEQNLYIKDAQFYDLDNRDNVKADIPFYIDYASKIKGDILELACGSGRITTQLAEAGHQVWGLEYSEQMLEQFRNKIKKLPQKTADKINVIQGDMSNFSLNRKFPFIILPARSFQLLYEEEKENACLKCVYDHLTDDGHFIIDIGNFVIDENNWVNDEEVFDWGNTDPATGYIVCRTHKKKEIDKDRKIIYPHKNYYILKDGKLINTIKKRSPWKYFTAEKIKNLLTSNGFRIIEELGFYDGTRLSEGSEFLFICEKG